MSEEHGDFARVPVPIEARKTSLWIAATSSAWIIAVTTLFTGGSIAEGIGLNEAVWAVIIGIGVVAVVSYYMGNIGARYNVSTGMLAHYTFGKAGAKLLGLVLALTLGIGWFAWQISFFATTLHELYPNYMLTEPRYSMIWAGLLMIATAYGGFRWLSLLSFIAVPLVLVLAGYGMIIALSSFPEAASRSVADIAAEMNIYGAITAVVGSVIFGAIVLPDISRYARGANDGAISVTVGYAISGIVVMLAGAVMVSAVNVPSIGQTANIPAVMSALGFGVAAFLVLLFAQWTTNDSNLYSGALGLASATKIPKAVAVLTMGILGIVIASLNIQEMFVPFLIVLGTFMPPVAGVMVADYYLGQSANSEINFERGANIANINLVNIIIVLVSGFGVYFLANLGGVFASSAIIGFLVSFLVTAAIWKAAPSLSSKFSIGTATL